ncbi:MAG: shikimate kinase [Ferruginibacter sp.]
MRIFLIGFMGSGKTHWGRLWAAARQLTFIDLDEEIEKQEGTISLIFEEKGEDYFRKKEADALRAQTLHDNCIISCGGGVPCFYDNMNWMNENGTTVFLEASREYIFNNITKKKYKRPLLNEKNDAEIMVFIEQKLKERRPFYEMAQIKFPVENLNIDLIDQAINS